MVKHVWSVLCRRSIIDSETNNISLNDIFEQLEVNAKIKKENENSEEPKKLNVPIEFEIVSMWVKDNEQEFKAGLRIDIFDPEGKLIKNFIQKLEMTSTMKRLRSRLRIMGLVVENTGNYTFKVLLKEEGKTTCKNVAELPLEVHVNKTLE